MLSDWFRDHTRWFIIPLARLFARARISPNVLTVVGFLLNIGVAWVLAKGYLRLSGLLIIFTGIFDSLDGALARETARTSRFGAFLDSVLDRFSEAAIFFGLFLFSFQLGDNMNLILIYAALIGSLLVSYARARAEGVGIECKGGFFTRFERIAILVIGLLLAQLRYALWVLAILANLTALQRIYLVWRATHRGRD